MDQEFMDEIDDGFELEEYRDSVYVRLAKAEQRNRELEAENRRLKAEVSALNTGDLSEAYAAGERKIIDLLAASNARVKKLKEELADVLRCSGENAKAWIESVEQGAVNRTQLLTEIGLGEQRIKQLKSELQTAHGSTEDSELLDWMEANPRLIVASTGYRGAKDSWCWRDATEALCTHEAPSLRAAIKAARDKSGKG